MEKFRIEWHDRTDGYLELIVDRFFPCIAEKSKKVFKLVAMYCSDEAIDELQAYLEQKKADAEWKGKELVSKYYDSPNPSIRKKRLAEVRKQETLFKRYEANLKMLKKCTGRK
ncbi:MAG: hypothetical protein DBX36_00180 [Oscillospiraceae bacterium]|nr:MAG: hypothetical protein DBX36_00180 [Oscillospiraceae bacterium]